MDLFLNIVYLVAGLTMLWFGADWMVAAAVRLALRAKIKPAVIGVTIVAFGTSAPELITTVLASMRGETAVAVGTILGSNICNILLALGLTASIRPIPSDMEVFRWDGPWMLLSAGSLALFAWIGGSVTTADGSEAEWALQRWEGALLLLLFVGFLVSTFIRVRRHRSVATEEVGEEIAKLSEKHWGVDVAIFLGGLAILVVGADRTVEGAVGLASMLGIPAAVIGLTVVAFGTSLPEIATSVTSARKGENAMAIANVTGSNIQNIVLCLALAAVVLPSGAIPIDQNAATIDMAIMFGVTVMLLAMMRFSKELGRLHAAILLVCYGGFVAYLAMRSL